MCLTICDVCVSGGGAKLIKQRMSKMIQVGKQLFYNNNHYILMLYYTNVALQTEVTLYSQFTALITVITAS